LAYAYPERRESSITSEPTRAGSDLVHPGFSEFERGHTDLGARVIKVERPGSGDLARSIGYVEKHSYEVLFGSAFANLIAHLKQEHG
jgi:hypothetical protein